MRRSPLFTLLAVISLIITATWAGFLPQYALQKVLDEASEIFGVYVQDNGPLATWMSTYPDNTQLARLNIPGTHDTATWNYTQATQDALANVTARDGSTVYPPAIYRCQSASIIASLSAGIRFFDLRFALDPTGTQLVFWHSQALMSEVSTVGDVLFAFFYWLDVHSSETVILSFQYEGSTIAGATSDAKVQSMIFDILNSTAATGRYVEQTHDELPLLGEARGKAILFRRFDLDALSAEYQAVLPGLYLPPSLWPDDGKDIALVYNADKNLTAYIEDYYEPNDLDMGADAATNIAAKLNATVAHLEKAAAQDSSSLFITFTSAEHNLALVTPEIMALGNGTQTTPLGGVNQQLLPVLKSMKGQRLGIVAVDFWDQPGELIESILGL